jgi:aminoglycoside 6'-N-acetyltransferase I
MAPTPPAQPPQIRELEERDIAACVRLYCAAYETPPYDHGWDEETAERIIRDVARLFPGDCLVAELEGDVVGFILCSNLAGLRTTIEEFAVAPAFQRRGVGKALFDHAVAAARARGVPFMELVASRQAPAYRFYLREGFRETGEYRLMSKDL